MASGAAAAKQRLTPLARGSRTRWHRGRLGMREQEDSRPSLVESQRMTPAVRGCFIPNWMATGASAHSR
uniref:Uncharacterized protein n=1 Tax=Oryza glumipatula TaxID=40148 RepID=A0A0E0B235_9ORYZ